MSEPNYRMPDERPLRVALMGAGERGQAVLRNWIQITGCQVAAILDPNETSLQRTVDYLQREVKGVDLSATAVTSDISSWLRSADADVVTVNSWDPQHAQNAIACFEAGLNVQVAKPLAQHTADCDAVYTAWKKSGKIGVVDMQIRTSLLAQKAKQMIEDGAVGTVRLITCADMVGRSGAEFRYQRSRRKDMIQSWTLAKGVHALDLCNFFMGDQPTRAYASGGRDVFGGTMPSDLHCPECDLKEECQFEGSKATIGGIPYPVKDSLCVFADEVDITDNLTAVLEYQGGGRVNYTECYFTPEYETLLDIIGERGALRVRYAMDERLWLEYRPRGSSIIEHIDIYSEGGGHGGGDYNILRLMAGALRENRQMHPDILDGRNAVALAEAIDTSIETRMPVEIPALPEVENS
jgi:predicted dehydrogenase